MTDQNELREDCGKPEAWRGGGTMLRPVEAGARAEAMAVRRAVKARALATGSPCPECGFRHALAASPTAEAERPQAEPRSTLRAKAHTSGVCPICLQSVGK